MLFKELQNVRNDGDKFFSQMLAIVDEGNKNVAEVRKTQTYSIVGKVVNHSFIVKDYTILFTLQIDDGFEIKEVLCGKHETLDLDNLLVNHGNIVRVETTLLFDSEKNKFSNEFLYCKEMQTLVEYKSVL